MVTELSQPCNFNLTYASGNVCERTHGWQLLQTPKSYSMQYTTIDGFILKLVIHLIYSHQRASDSGDLTRRIASKLN